MRAGSPGTIRATTKMTTDSPSRTKAKPNARRSRAETVISRLIPTDNLAHARTIPEPCSVSRNGRHLANGGWLRSYAADMHPYIHAQKHPDKPAYIMAATGETVTYRQLDDQSNRIAQLFRSLGLRARDHVAIHLENNPRFFEICWGAQRAGLVYTAISSRLTAPEVEYIVNDCGATLFVTSSYLREKAADLANLMPGVANRYMIGRA